MATVPIIPVSQEMNTDVLVAAAECEARAGVVEAGVPPVACHVLSVLTSFNSRFLINSMTAILGISAFYHDSAAALVVDGKIVAAAQEERFTRKKHDARFPKHAVDYCLREAGLTPDQLDYVGFYDKPLRTFERLLETYLAFAPAGFRSFRSSIPVWLKEKLHLPREIRKGLREQYKGRFVFTNHHESHAASAFFPSPFDDAAILTLDGVGEWATASWGAGRGNRIELTHELHFPHSLGLLYSAFTYYCGFKVNSGEYKLMGLAPYGAPRYVDELRSFIDVDERGAIHLDQDFFDYCHGLRMTSSRFDARFGFSAMKRHTVSRSGMAPFASSFLICFFAKFSSRSSRRVSCVWSVR